MVLINSRMSDKSFARRRKGAAMFRNLLGMFDAALVQNPDTRDRFVALGADPAALRVTGALKGAPRPLPADPAKLAALQAAIGDRPVWLAASTEAREEAAVADAHLAILESTPGALLILAPRHPRLAAATRTLLDDRFAHVAQRSLGEVPQAATQIYLADSIGEMGLWYRLADVTFMGHSLPVPGPPLPGKNPFEAVVFDTAVLHGPSVPDFEETYARLDAAGATVPVDTSESLHEAVRAALEPQARRRLTGNAARVLDQTRKVLDDTYDTLAPYLDPAPD